MRPATFVRQRLGLPLSLVGCIAAGLVPCIAALAVLALLALDPYRRPPRPDGMVLRLAIGEVDFPEQHVSVVPAPGGRPAFRIRNRWNGEERMEVLEVAFPSGESRVVPPPEDAASPVPAPPLDLDGDGVLDHVRIGPDLFERTVDVVSGATGAVIFSDRDRFEHARKERAFPLGDLDGDGYDELALVHPREDRNAYDLEPGDALFGVHGWVTVVSGGRLGR